MFSLVGPVWYSFSMLQGWNSRLSMVFISSLGVQKNHAEEDGAGVKKAVLVVDQWLNVQSNNLPQEYCLRRSGLTFWSK